MSRKALFFSKRFILPCFISAFLLAFCLFPVEAKDDGCEILYTVQLKKLHPDVRPSILRLENVTDAVSKSHIGVIESVSFTPHTQENYSSLHDCIVEAPHPYFYDAVITVRGECHATKDAYIFSAFKLALGAPVHFFTANFTGSGECTGIYPVEASR